jgi:hypothetical protein
MARFDLKILTKWKSGKKKVPGYQFKISTKYAELEKVGGA